MTLLADQPAPAAPTPRVAGLRTLALVEARRYSRHPLLWAGLAGLVVTSGLVTRDLSSGTANLESGMADLAIMPAFFLGFLGVLVGVQLTRSTARCADPVEAAPTDGVTRTAALSLACLVPGAIALVWLGWFYLVQTLWLIPQTALTKGQVLAIVLAGVVAAVGGPLFGILVGRWTRFPGAGLVAVVFLYAWALLAAGGLAVPPSRLGSLARLNAPFVGWVSADGPTHAHPWIAGGSPWWYLVYVSLLCALAVCAALFHEATGQRRARLLRTGCVVALLAVACLALAAAPDPTRIPL